jgi:hypothetical protein
MLEIVDFDKRPNMARGIYDNARKHSLKDAEEVIGPCPRNWPVKRCPPYCPHYATTLSGTPARAPTRLSTCLARFAETADG